MVACKPCGVDAGRAPVGLMPGWIIPAPLAMPPSRTVLPPSRNSTAICLDCVSLVRMASAASAAAACVGWTLGFDHPLFALAAMVAFVVMYDASGIRRNAGLTAERVNGLPDSLWPEAPEKPLKESLGHSRLQVLVGSLMGPAIALPGLEFVGSPLHLLSGLGAGLG